jgi:hypothetical protein
MTNDTKNDDANAIRRDAPPEPPTAEPGLELGMRLLAIRHVDAANEDLEFDPWFDDMAKRGD